MRVLGENTGKRLLASVIDSHAAQRPESVWASIPFDQTDMKKGFRDITYKEFADAINTASFWLEGITRDSKSTFETLAYAGPKDLRYPILAVAAVKCGKQLLLASPLVSSGALEHLLGVTSCGTYLHAASSLDTIPESVSRGSNLRLIQVPELSDWLFAGDSDIFPYNKTWESAHSDPWLIFHTSGTTGLPKPVVYTNLMMTSFDAAELMPDADEETMNDLFRNTRCYTPLPHLHYVGMTAALQWTTFLNMILVVGPPRTASSAETLQILEYGKASGAVLPPSLIDEICRNPEDVTKLRRLEYIYFAGAPLSASSADHLVGHCKVQPGMGSTEAGAYFISIRNDDDWQYYCFRPSMGVDFEQRTPELYELMFRRRPELLRWQQVFHVYTDVDVFYTKDLWIRHPYKPDLWRYGARADDLVILSHGECLWASEMESIIERHPYVKAALIGGQGKPRPFVLIELDGSSTALEDSHNSNLAETWPVIAQANEKCSEYVRLSKDLVIFTQAQKPLPRTVKNTVPRQPSFDLYTLEIERLYT